MEVMNNVSIQGNPLYINYQFDFFTFPVLVASIPLFYLIPTVLLIMKIFQVYCRQLIIKREESMNPHVFMVIVTSQITSFFYMISEYIVLRLPFTGVFTSWCASQEPNHFLKILIFFYVYFTYAAWLFPFLLSSLRLIPVYFPQKHNEFCARIVKIAIPLIFIYPLIFTFTMIPALGFCVQLLGPYQFGAIYPYFSGSWFDTKMIKGLVVNLVLWMLLSTAANLLLFLKLKKLKNKRKSKVLQRAELSITFTSLSMLLCYITNLACGITFIISPSLAVYFIALRPFANDCETVLVPWIFYMTHPIFKKNKISPKDISRLGTLHPSSTH